MTSSAWGAVFFPLQDDEGHTFYYCPQTSECCWDIEPGNFIMPASDHWWELIDTSRDLPYYYHAEKKITTWHKPDGFVIPMTAIQMSPMAKRFSLSGSRDSYIAAPQNPPTPKTRQVTIRLPNSSSAPSISSILNSPGLTTSTSSSTLDTYTTAILADDSGIMMVDEPVRKDSIKSQRSIKNHRRTSSLGILPSSMTASSDNEESHSSAPPLSDLDKIIARLANSEDETLTRPRPSLLKSSSSSFFRRLRQASADALSIPARSPVADSFRSVSGSPSRRPLSPASTTSSPKRRPIASPKPSSPNLSMLMEEQKRTEYFPFIPSSPSKNSSELLAAPMIGKRSPSTNNVAQMNTALPSDLLSEIGKIRSMDGYAKQHFASQRTGLFRRHQPLEKTLTWTKHSITSPILNLPKELRDGAVRSFALIQQIMGDRELLQRQETEVEAITDPWTADILNAAKSVCSIGLSHISLRDEVYVQLVRQLTQNPLATSNFRGWQLMQVLLVVFPPSKGLESTLRSFLASHISVTKLRIHIMAKHCLMKLAAICQKGARGKAPTVHEISAASEAAFKPSVFGETLEKVMDLQVTAYPDSKVPIILPFLADSILALNGLETEGIFRIGGDIDTTTQLKISIDSGHYDLTLIEDSHTAASMLKLWLRELAEPLIPHAVYEQCIKNADYPSDIIRILKSLSLVNRRVISFVISFLQLFCSDSIIEKTRMPASSLAMVFAPNFLRCTASDLEQVFNNSRLEQAFVRNLLLHLKPTDLDGTYTPSHPSTTAYVASPSHLKPFGEPEVAGKPRVRTISAQSYELAAPFELPRSPRSSSPSPRVLMTNNGLPCASIDDDNLESDSVTIGLRTPRTPRKLIKARSPRGRPEISRNSSSE